MSSTNRGKKRNKEDFYITPEYAIKDFFSDLRVRHLFKDAKRILDPCAGGNEKYDMPYPAVLQSEARTCVTIDKRLDSRATIKRDFLDVSPSEIGDYDLVISNPPFGLAEQFILHSRKFLNRGGFICFLLRLNFFGGQARQKFFKQHMPAYCFIHSRRISFFPENFELDGKLYRKGSTDSIEYAHFIWSEELANEFTKTYII